VRDHGGPVRGLAALAAALALACAGEAPRRGPALQVTGDSVKVRRDDPLPATSAIFDGEVVRLRAARGETLGVVVWRAAPGPAPVALTVDGAVVTGYRIAHHRVRRRSTRMWGPSGGAGWWPDRLERVDGAVPAERAAYFTVAVAAAAAPGPRRGTLAVGEERWPVELTIDPVVLPPLGAAPRVWAYYDPREIARAAGVTGEAALAAEHRFAALLRAHGVAASPDLHLDDWPGRRALVAGLPWVPVVLPAEPAAEAAAVRGWLAALADTDQAPFAIPIDEPRRLWQKLAVRARAAGVRQAGGGRFLYAVTDAPHWVYGDLVDLYVSPFAVRLEGPAPVAGRTPPRWTYNGTPPHAGAMILDTDGAALRTWGWIGWRWRVPLWYVWDGAYWSDRHNVRRRGGPRFPPPTAVDEDAVTFDDGEDHGNLDGVLAFWTAAGPAPSLRLAALRRGLQDRALLELLEDCAGRAVADAIAAPLVPTALADAAPRGASRAGAWPTDEPAWEAARHRLLDALAACAR
jgi:hypothetical protein